MGFPARHNTWEPVENILDKRLITSFYKEHPRAKHLTNTDYVPNNVALLSWTESLAGVTIVAALAPVHEPSASRQDEPLINPGCPLHVVITDLAATPNLTQVPVIPVDVVEGLMSSNPVPCPQLRSSTSDITHPTNNASTSSPGVRHRLSLTVLPVTRLWLFLLFMLSAVNKF